MELAWEGVSKIDDSNVIMTRSGGCFEYLKIGAPIVVKNSKYGNNMLKMVAELQSKTFNQMVFPENDCFIDQLWGINNWIPTLGRHNSRSPRPDDAGIYHVYDILLKV